jgi:hypothetical protein
LFPTIVPQCLAVSLSDSVEEDGEKTPNGMLYREKSESAETGMKEDSMLLWLLGVKKGAGRV